MKSLFIGSTRRGWLTLKAILEAGLPVGGVVSLAQHEHETERYEAPIRQLAERHGLALREAKSLQSPELVTWVRGEVRAEVAFAVGVRVLLPATLYTAFPRGCWGVHDSLLPAYRGFAPLNWAIINGETETGVSLFRVSDGMDTGEVLLQRRVPIGPVETAPEVYEKICAATIEAVLEGHRLLRDHAAQPAPQDHSRATYTCSRTPADGLIDWNQPTTSIFNLIRALTFPYPGAFTLLAGRPLYILSAEPVAEAPAYVGRIPGRVVKIGPEGAVEVLTRDGVLRLHEISTDGVARRKPAEVIRSVRERLGPSGYAPVLPPTPPINPTPLL
jgi:methionyl-tRNA formyltransferase